MRRHARGGGKCAGEMKDAKTRDIGKVGDGDVVSKMLFDVCENTPQPYVIQPMWCQYRQPNELRLGVRMRQPRREQQRRRFHELPMQDVGYRRSASRRSNDPAPLRPI